MVVRYLRQYSQALMGYALRANGIAPDAEPTEKTARRTVRLSDQKLEK